jgi:hypothetical protein
LELQRGITKAVVLVTVKHATAKMATRIRDIISGKEARKRDQGYGDANEKEE